MAKTFIKRTLAPRMGYEAALQIAATYLPEGSSQTFLDGSPLIFSSGLMVVATGTVEVVAAFALENGHNNTGAKIKCLPALIGVGAYGSFLATNAADNTLATADLGVKVQLLYGATAGAGSTPIWFWGDSASTPAAKIVSFTGDPEHILPNQSELDAANGDTNARVFAALIGTAAAWNL